MKRKFTDKFVRAVPKAPKGKRVEFFDLQVPNFGVRVTATGHKTYILYTRFPGSKAPTRREIGDASKLPLIDARRIAREWLRDIEMGIDTRAAERAAEIEAQRKTKATFLAVVEDWFRDDVSKMAKCDEIKRVIRWEFREWFDRPITSITTLEIRDIVKNKALGLIPAPRARKLGPAPAQARNLLGYVKQAFSYAVNQHAYGLEKSPADPLRGDKLIGQKVRRKRALSHDELRAVWSAAEETEYPYGPLFRMLIMTGQRKSEVAGARWSEFNMTRKLWIIPAERMKMKEPHTVPLTEDLIALLAELPRFNTGKCLFSTTFGERPCNGFSKAKERLDELVGDIPHWVIHDLRRTMRSELSDLEEISQNVQERMIAHAQPPLVDNYDRHDYTEKMRRGFGLYHARLREILAAPPESESNVVALHA